VKLNMSSKKPSPMCGNKKVGVIVCQTISYSTQILEFIQMNDLLIYRIESMVIPGILKSRQTIYENILERRKHLKWNCEYRVILVNCTKSFLRVKISLLKPTVMNNVQFSL